jgi:hypothetical protein
MQNKGTDRLTEMDMSCVWNNTYGITASVMIIHYILVEIAIAHHIKVCK